MIIFRSSLPTHPIHRLFSPKPTAAPLVTISSLLADRTVLSALRLRPVGPTVMFPDSTNMQATHSGQLPLHSSPSATAKTAHILDGMTNSLLISIGQLCDDDCVAALGKRKLQVFKRNACVLSGTRNKIDGLWDIALPISRPASTKPKAPLQLNATIRKDVSKTNLAQCLHGCLGSPVVSTWKLAIANGNFITWPGIDTLSIDAHLPKNIASAKGHMDQERKNLQSTRVKFFPIAARCTKCKDFCRLRTNCSICRQKCRLPRFKWQISSSLVTRQ
jgi:hypothetical protein